MGYIIHLEDRDYLQRLEIAAGLLGSTLRYGSSVAEAAEEVRKAISNLDAQIARDYLDRGDNCNGTVQSKAPVG